MNEQDFLTQVELNCLRSLEEKDDIHLLQKTSTIYEPNKQKEEDTFDLLFNLHPHPELQEAKRRLELLRQQSDKLSSLEAHLGQFKDTFQHLADTEASLEESIKIIQGDSGHILEKQNKMVALSLEMQEILDRYNYISKFKFDDVVEIYNDAGNLQLTLSELTDGIQFFVTHPSFSNSKKYLQRYRDEKMKTLGFVRGHLLKMFTKQDTFVMKQSKPIHLQNYFENCYPKATFKFLADYLTLYPQFKSELNDLYFTAKENQENIPQGYVKRDQQIEEFLLDGPIKTLIRYIEMNQPELHSDSLLKLVSFYRTNLHQQLVTQYTHKKQPLQDIFQILYYLTYIIPSQMTYITYCLGLSRANNLDAAKAIIMNIVNIYSQLVKPPLKQIKSWREIFMAYRKLNQLLEGLTEIIDNYAFKMEYKVYPLGKVMNLMVTKTDTILEILRGIFDEIFSFLEQSLEFYLPKDWSIQKIVCPQPSIQQLIEIIPNLKYCPKLCNKYIIQSIDSILRAISNANSQLETRYESFLWNITSIYGIQVALASARLTKPLLKTEMSLNLGGTVSVLDTVSKIENKGNIWNYAKEIFSVLSTGLPVLNELTVDFNQHLKAHIQKLQSQFVKDLTFIYGKSMIEFLQKLHNHEEEESKTLLSADSLKQEYERLVLGMDQFVSESIKQFQVYKKGYIVESIEYGPKLLVLLMEQVLENLIELLSQFYISTSKTVNVQLVKQLEFKDIKEIKQKIIEKLKKK